MSCELVVLFNPKNDGKLVIPQLEKYLDKIKSWDMVVCSRMTWSRLEEELSELINARYEKIKVRGYDKVTATSDGSVAPSEVGPTEGFNSLTWRGKPICYIDGNNIVSARVGAMNE